MPIFHCAHCGQPIDADETLAGVEVGCPACFAVIQVPAPASEQNYQPYQPPVFAQPPERSSSHAGHSSDPDKWRIRAPVFGTAAAFVLCLLKKISEPATSLDVALGNAGFASTLAGAIGYALAAGIVALVVALVIAGIAAACQKPFLTMLSRSYGIGAVLTSLLMLAGPMLQPRNARPQQTQTNHQTREELNKLQEDIQKMQAGVMPADDTLPSKTMAPLPNDASTTEKQLRIVRQHVDEVAAWQKSYETEIEKMGFDRLLDAGRLAADKDLSESYGMLKRASTLLMDHGTKIRETMASLPARIRASDLTPSIRESTAQRAEAKIQDTLKIFNETWTLEESILVHFTTIIDLLKNRSGHWEVNNNQILFAENRDLESYNVALGKIDEAVARQDEIQNKAAQRMEQVFEYVRSGLPN